MGSRTLVEEEQIEETVKKISTESFTVPDFIQAFKRSFPDDWERLVERFGLFSSKKRYIVTTYLSNRLDVYSQKRDSVLVPFTRYKQS